MHFSAQQTLFAFLLAVVQVAAALPWLAVFNWAAIRTAVLGGPRTARGGGLASVAGFLVVAVLVLGAVGAGYLTVVQDADTLKTTGRVYGAVLQLQLGADLIVVVFALLLLLWPKGGAVALSAFREGVRQPMFWLLAALAALLMLVSPYIPYFTFGEDHKMVEELGYDTIMLAALLFGTLAASLSISEEIEGRTAVTLMSKPVSRRQFLIGKFLGILVAGVAMTILLGWIFDWVNLYKLWYDRVDPVQVALPLTERLAHWLPSAGGARNLFAGVELWGIDAGHATPGLVIGFCQVMVLLAIAVSLATRLPMVINLVICLGVYFLGHLTPVLVQIAREHSLPEAGGLPVSQILAFMAQLFDTLLPGLDYFSLGTSVIRDNPLPTGPFLVYVASVVGYAVLYTVIVLVFGLILFEDRDLA